MQYGGVLLIAKISYVDHDCNARVKLGNDMGHVGEMDTFFTAEKKDQKAKP